MSFGNSVWPTRSLGSGTLDSDLIIRSKFETLMASQHTSYSMIAKEGKQYIHIFLDTWSALRIFQGSITSWWLYYQHAFIETRHNTYHRHNSVIRIIHNAILSYLRCENNVMSIV
jgi:hypothetical protein